MIAYTTIGTNDMAKAKAFYDALFEELPVKLVYSRPDGGFISYGIPPGQPAFGIAKPYNGESADPGNGNMVAIAADSPEQVQSLYNKAISLGAVCEGPAGPRVGGNEYCGYVRDLDGNKLNFFFISALGDNAPE